MLCNFMHKVSTYSHNMHLSMHKIHFFSNSFLILFFTVLNSYQMHYEMPGVLTSVLMSHFKATKLTMIFSHATL